MIAIADAPIADMLWQAANPALARIAAAGPRTWFFGCEP